MVTFVSSYTVLMFTCLLSFIKVDIGAGLMCAPAMLLVTATDSPGRWVSRVARHIFGPTVLGTKRAKSSGTGRNDDVTVLSKEEVTVLDCKYLYPFSKL